MSLSSYSNASNPLFLFATEQKIILMGKTIPFRRLGHIKEPRDYEEKSLYTSIIKYGKGR